MMTFDITKSSKIQNGHQNDAICKKMANFHTLLACNMSFCRLFGSRNTILKRLTSVYGWSYTAKVRNFDIKWGNFVKKWFNLIHYWLITHLYRGVWVKRQTFETLVVNFFLYMVGLTWQYDNSNVRLHSLARKWFHLHKLLACSTSL